MPDTRPKTFLLADVGGTNTRTSLSDGAQVRSDTIRRYRNAEHGHLDQVLRHAMDDLEASGADISDLAGACIAVAGPVHEDHAELTNLNWKIDRNQMAEALGLREIRLLNDLQAQGHALDDLPEASLRPILPQAESSDQAVRLVVGIGTGFNVAPVYHTAAERIVPPSEAGHSTLSFASEDDLDLAQFQMRNGRALSIEEVLSGRGIVHLYQWRCAQAGQDATLTAGDILATGAADQNPVARRAIADFVRFAGGVLGDLALTFLPFGGIYLAGGVARAFADHYAPMGLADAMQNKGRFADFVRQFGVWIIDDDYAALTGCAAHMQRIAGQTG